MQEDRSNSIKPFYIVSMGKFSVLFLATLGYYGIYWFYKNWANIGKYQNRNTYPVLRAAFCVFFIPQLCKELTNYQQQSQRSYHWNLSPTYNPQHSRQDQQAYHWTPTLFVVGYIGLSLISLPLSYGIAKEAISLQWLWLQLPVLFFQYYLTYQFQLVANYVCDDAFGKANETYTLANHAWIIVGFILWFDQIKLLYLITTGQTDQLNM